MFEKFLETLMNQAGIKPAQIVQAYQFVAQLQTDVEGAKAGLPQIIGHFNAQLAAIDQRLAKIEQLLTLLGHQPANAPAKLNGEATHV